MTGKIMDLPLLESQDLPEPGVLQPTAGPAGVPDVAVVCFFKDVVDQWAEKPGTSEVGRLDSVFDPRSMYVREHAGRRIGFFYPGIGAPFATFNAETAMAWGVKGIIAVGTCGVLVPELVLGHPVVVTSALRDEGTSAHYCPPSRVIDLDPVGIAAVREACENAQVEYTCGRAWTTDAIFRETRSRVARRVAEGCIVVEMEAAALAAVAAFRGVHYGQVLFSADSLAGEEWDHRHWATDVDNHQATFLLAMDAAARLP